MTSRVVTIRELDEEQRAEIKEILRLAQESAYKAGYEAAKSEPCTKCGYLGVRL